MRMIEYSRCLLAAAAVFCLAGCNLDLEDPTNPSEEAVLDATGVKQIGVGLQAEYGDELSDPVYISALVADEVGAIPAAFESYRLVDAGLLPVGNDLGPSTETWAGQYDVIQIANVLLTNVPQLTTLTPEMSNALTALAKTFKAMAFGNLLLVYERVPLVVGLDQLNPAFATRVEGLALVLSLLQEARQQLIATPMPLEFTRDILAPGFNLPNTIDAMIARFSMVSGDYPGALAAAQRVDLGILSEFRFGPVDPNPVFNMWYNSGNSVAMRPEDRFRLTAEAGDQRVAYWVTAAAITGSTVPLDDLAKYRARDVSFPAYLPDEVRLIQAEVYARQNNLPQALILLNQVRTQCASPLAEPVACLPPLTLAQVPTQPTMLDRILQARQYELFVQGVSWSDLRRFGKPVKYSFMSVSSAECSRNQSAPADLCDQTVPGS